MSASSEGNSTAGRTSPPQRRRRRTTANCFLHNQTNADFFPDGGGPRSFVVPQASLLAVDGGGPAADVLAGHGPLRGEAGVLVAPLFHVDEILFARKKGALADPPVRRRRVLLFLQAAQEILHHPVRDAGALPRIGEPEPHEVAEQDAPVRAEALQQARPVEVWPRRAEQVVDVGTVVALALKNITFRPDHLLDRAKGNRLAEHVPRGGV